MSQALNMGCWEKTERENNLGIGGQRGKFYMCEAK